MTARTTPRSRSGFSMLELLVAAALLSVIALAVIGAISQSAKEVKTTSEYSLSLFLSQKVVEELLQSVHENPYAGESLGEIAGARTAVRDGLNPYYAALEDDQQPFGTIDPGVDLRVEERAPDLFRLYRDFSFTLAEQGHPIPELPGSPVNAQEIELHYDWAGLKGAQRDFYFSCLLAKSVVKPPPSHPLIGDIPGMDEAILTLLYPELSGTLPPVVAGFDGDLSTVRDLGAIAVLGEDVEESQSAISASLESALDRSPDRDPSATEDPELRLEIATLYERRAALAWQALQLMRDPANRSKNFKKKDVGDKKIERFALADGVSEALTYWNQLHDATAHALRQYALAREGLEPLVFRPYRTYSLERKIIELIKLRALLTGSPDLTYLHEWLDHLRDIYAGRNRIASDFLSRERIECADLDGIRTLHPEIVTRIDQGEAAHDDLEKVMEQVKKELFKKDALPLGL